MMMTMMMLMIMRHVAKLLPRAETKSIGRIRQMRLCIEKSSFGTGAVNARIRQQKSNPVPRGNRSVQTFMKTQGMYKDGEDGLSMVKFPLFRLQ